MSHGLDGAVRNVHRDMALPRNLGAPLIAESASPLSAVETNFAVDATGFGTTTYGRWFDHKWGKHKKRRALWLKAHAMIGVKTNIVTAINVTKGNEGDAPYLPILLDETIARFNPEELSADKAYLTFNNLTAIDTAGATPYIKFKSNSKDNPASAAWSRMFHMFHAHRDEFLPHYHRRSNVETTFSMVKRKFGSHVRAINHQAQVNEVLCKFLCHNLAVLNTEIHKLGIDPHFWMPEESEAAE